MKTAINLLFFVLLMSVSMSFGEEKPESKLKIGIKKRVSLSISLPDVQLSI